MTLDELKKLCDNATPGPWGEMEGSLANLGYCHFRYATGPWINYLASKNRGTPEYSNDVKQYNNQVASDSAFIAASRTYMPLLIEVAKAASQLDIWIDKDNQHAYIGAPELKNALSALKEAIHDYTAKKDR